jgi:tetratricopeptide (TPR) repeat protein
MRIRGIRLGLLALCGGAAMLAGAHAADVQTRDAPDLTGVRAAIKVKNYDSALAQLKPIVATSSHPDVLSLMGFALRKTGDRAQSMVYYRRALEADPTHKGALEYQGELFVELGQMDQAKANLAKLGKLCWFKCEEEEDLKEAIEHASAKK